MKIIRIIALAELKKLFYSPVAWFILVIFSFQIALNLTGAFDTLIRIFSLGSTSGGLTRRVFGGESGVFGFFAAYTYIYIPLITMGIMSRELSTGSIKLLYSSPITNWQIILGKYLALMAFGLALVGFVIVFAAFGAITIVHADLPQLLCGLLGIYFLICAYSAIGLFLSTLTSYIVVAAIGTIGIFAILNYIGGIGQDIPVMRDITYWFSITGRVNTFLSGMITSEDVLYFIIVVMLFLSFTMIKLQSGRRKINWMITAGKYLAVLLVAMLLGYTSALPKLKGYKDLTYTKSNTLSRGSQQIIAKVPDNTVITTYTNMLSQTIYYTVPSSYKLEQKLFENYLRFNPTLKLKYVYFYYKTDNPNLDRRYPNLNDKQRLDTLKNNLEWNFKISSYSDIANHIDLSSEDYRSVRLIETPDGKKTFLRFFDDVFYLPNESEVSAAFKHLIVNAPTLGFLTGQGERGATNSADEGYSKLSQDKTYRNALINQGVDFENVTLDKPIPQKIRALVIADMRSALTETEQKNLEGFIAGGGNMMILGEPGKQSIMNSLTAPLGVSFLPGTLVHKPGILPQVSIQMQPTAIGRQRFSFLDDIVKQYSVIIMPTVSGLEADTGKGFHVLPMLTTQADSCWSDLQTTNFTDDTATFDPVEKEIKKSCTTVLGLERMVGKKQQKIIIAGDADWLSNGELNKFRKEIKANSALSSGMFSWLCDGEAPVDISRTKPIDNALRIDKHSWATIRPFLKWVFPGLFMLIGIIIWMRRKGR